MTSPSSVVSPSPIQIGQLIKLTDDHGDTVALKLVFANYKHSYNQRPFSIVIDRHPLTSCGLNPSRSKGHSFRIRAASFAADRGMCDAQIRALGRWKSSACLKYIRLRSLSST